MKLGKPATLVETARAVITILPPRPLLLDSKQVAALRRRLWLLTLLIGGVGAGFSAGCAYFTQEILDERALWAGGVEGQVLDVSGEVRQVGKLGLTLIYEYRLTIEYLDANGGTHKGKSEFDLFWSELEEQGQPKLRHDPSQPERFVLSFPIEAGLSRWGLALLMGGLGVFMLGSLVALVRNDRRRRHWLEMCAEDGDEILAPLLSVTQVQGTITVKFAPPESQKPVSEVVSKPPLVVMIGEAPHVVMLRSPREPESRIVITEDLSPFAIDSEMREAVSRRVAAAAGQAGSA